MQRKQNEKTEYFLNLPVSIAGAFPVAGYLLYIGFGEISLLFFLCYFVMFLLTMSLLVYWERKSLVLPVSLAVMLILSLMSRDLVLIINMLLPLSLLMLFFWIGSRPKLKTIGWTVVTILEMTLWCTCYSSMPRYVAICLVTLIIFTGAQLLRRDLRMYIIIPLLICIASIFLPVKDEPYRWDIVRKAASTVGDFFGRFSLEADYFFQGFGFGDNTYAGYSDTGALSGGLSNGERKELTFEHGGRLGIVHLKGRSYVTLGKDGFTDAEISSTDNSWFVEYINALYRSNVTIWESARFSSIITANVEYQYLRTTDVICPQNVISVDYDENGKKKKKKNKGFSYRVRYILIDYSNPYFKSVVKGETIDEEASYMKDIADTEDEVEEDVEPAAEKEYYADYETIKAYVRNLYKINLSEFMSEEEYNRLTDGETHYAAMSQDGEYYPDSAYLNTDMATDRIKELADEITADCETDYEKAVQIESYLRQYTYDKSVDLSKSENYIDDFLFDTCSGYCIHYASAMVLMLRAEGIPAKYTVGYSHEEGKDKYVVNNTEAHAWPEAYIDGYGWLIFEPTAAMETAEHYSWGLGTRSDREEDASEGDAQYGFDGNTEDMEKYYEQYMPSVPKSDEELEAEHEAEERNFRQDVIRKTVTYILVLLALAILIFVIIWLANYIRYRLMTPEQRLCTNVGVIMGRIDKLDQPDGVRKLFDYPSFVEDGEKRKELEQIMEAYARVRYRGDAPSEEDVSRSRRFSRYKSYNDQPERKIK